MSESLGARLPQRILRSLAGEPDGLDARAILVATTDAAGRPHPALLGYGEVVAFGPSTLRLAPYSGSTTAENLRQRLALTLCLVEPGAAHYVKARAHELPSSVPGRAFFEAAIEDVRADQVDVAREGSAHIATGITFAAADPARRLADERALREALRGAER